MRQALMAIEEVMGEPGLKAVLRASGLEKYIDNPFAWVMLPDVRLYLIQAARVSAKTLPSCVPMFCAKWMRST